jgi:hypothetical protein
VFLSSVQDIHSFVSGSRDIFVTAHFFFRAMPLPKLLIAQEFAEEAFGPEPNALAT